MEPRGRRREGPAPLLGHAESCLVARCRLWRRSGRRRRQIRRRAWVLLGVRSSYKCASRPADRAECWVGAWSACLSRVLTAVVVLTVGRSLAPAPLGGHRPLDTRARLARWTRLPAVSCGRANDYLRAPLAGGSSQSRAGIASPWSMTVQSWRSVGAYLWRPWTRAIPSRTELSPAGYALAKRRANGCPSLI